MPEARTFAASPRKLTQSDTEMNDRQLNYFIIAAEEKNLGRAAERLPLSLSALSRQIQSLEEELGAVLLIRTTSGLELTPAGEALLRHAQTLRTQFAQTKNAVQRAGDITFGRLDVGGFGSGLLIYIPQILKVFSSRYPQVETRLHIAPFTQQLEYLHHGRTLISFDRLFDIPDNIAVELAFKDSIVLALPDSHPLACKSAIRFEDLRDQPMLGRLDDKNHLPELAILQNHCGFELRFVQRVQDMVAAAAMAGSGLGLAFVPASLQKLRIPNVTYRPLLIEQELPCNLYGYYRKDETAPVLHALLKVVRQYCAENQS